MRHKCSRNCLRGRTSCSACRTAWLRARRTSPREAWRSRLSQGAPVCSCTAWYACCVSSQCLEGLPWTSALCLGGFFFSPCALIHEHLRGSFTSVCVFVRAACTHAKHSKSPAHPEVCIKSSLLPPTSTVACAQVRGQDCRQGRQKGVSEHLQPRHDAAAQQLGRL